MEIGDTAEVAALMQKAWVLIANAGWSETAKPEGWQDAAVKWRDEYQAWLNAASGASLGVS